MYEYTLNRYNLFPIFTTHTHKKKKKYIYIYIYIFPIRISKRMLSNNNQVDIRTSKAIMKYYDFRSQWDFFLVLFSSASFTLYYNN
jgi:hypothetical protein